VFFWWRDHHLPLSALFLSVPLLFVRGVRSEARTWGIVAGTLFVAGEVAPDVFFVVSLLAAAALCLRALAPEFFPIPERSEARAARPYRTCGEDVETATRVTVPVTSTTLGPGERARSLAGALFATYLAAWTVSWPTGPWPVHMLALDLALTVGIAILVWCTRVRSAVVPLVASYGHWVLTAHVVPVPRSSVAWGESAVALGFALLAGSLLASYRLRDRGGSTGAVAEGAPRPEG